MGCDIPLAVLSHRSQVLYNYFKQLFAQVTNPPIDPIREKIVMNTDSLLGSEMNLLEETPEHARLLRLKSPALPDAELAAHSRLEPPGLQGPDDLDPVRAEPGRAGLKTAMERICAAARQAVGAGRPS